MNLEYWMKRFEDASFEHGANDVVLLQQAQKILVSAWNAAYTYGAETEYQRALNYYDPILVGRHL